MKLEKEFESLRIRISSKIERDVRATSFAAEYVSRRVTKDTEKVLNAASTIGEYDFLYN